MPRIILVLAAALLTAFTARVSAAADLPIGAVTRIEGSASWLSGRTPQPLAVGAPVFTNQKVSTGAASRLELTFDDGTKLTLGENAAMTLDAFVYDPAGTGGRLAADVVGAFRFVSGRISKQAESEVAVATPFATVGIRGTDFWGGPIDGLFGAVFLIEGAVTVSNAAGTQSLETPGQGTNIATEGEAPGAVTLWPQDKVARALATVAFQ